MNTLAVETEKLTRRFGAVVALDRVTMSVRRGTVLGLLGCNGAGKSTLLKLLAGHLQPTSGSASVLGCDATNPDPKRWLKIGYVSQIPHLPEWMTGAECLEFARSFRPNWDRAATMALAKRFEIPLDRRTGELSRGHCVRLQTCIALGHHPELILLDEPTSGLDPEGRRELLSTLIEEIDRRSATVLLSSHLVDDLERLADTIAILNDGKLIAYGAPDELPRTRSQISVPLADSFQETDLSCMPGFLEWRRDGGTAVAITEEPEDALAFLQARGVDSAACTVPTLQQLFLDSIRRRPE